MNTYYSNKTEELFNPAYSAFKPNRRTIHQRSTGRNTRQIFMEVRLARKKKFINKTNIPEHEIEKIARCLFPDILAFYNSEEGQREFKEWKEAQSEKRQQ